MRTKPRTIAIAVLVFAIGAFAYAILTHEDEPRYQGKSLSEWLAIYHKHPSAARAEAELAIRSIGTNALPFLLEWMRYEPPPWREKLRTIVSSPRVSAALGYTAPKDWFIGKSAVRASQTPSVFSILRSNAIPAIPKLESLMKDNRTPVRGRRAIHALGGIGPPAIPVLTNALADPNQINRRDILLTLDWMTYRTVLLSDLRPGSGSRPDTYGVLPALIRALNDQDASVRSMATKILGLVAPEVLTNAPPQ